MTVTDGTSRTAPRIFQASPGSNFPGSHWSHRDSLLLNPSSHLPHFSPSPPTPILSPGEVYCHARDIYKNTARPHHLVRQQTRGALSLCNGGTALPAHQHVESHPHLSSSWRTADRMRRADHMSTHSQSQTSQRSSAIFKDPPTCPKLPPIPPSMTPRSSSSQDSYQAIELRVAHSTQLRGRCVQTTTGIHTIASSL